MYDPWGAQYQIRIDRNYDASVANPYSDSYGGSPIPTGVIVWCFGKDGTIGNLKKGTTGFADSDDVISWQ